LLVGLRGYNVQSLNAAAPVPAATTTESGAITWRRVMNDDDAVKR
jgi:hypothetical protein